LYANISKMVRDTTKVTANEYRKLHFTVYMADNNYHTNEMTLAD